MAEAFLVLGAVAAATQFADQAVAIAVKFHGTFSEIKSAPATVQNRLSEIEQLIGLARLIIANAALQTESIASILRDCLRPAVKLQGLLKDYTPGADAGKLKKLKKAFTSVLNENAVQKEFQSLDRCKASLVIAMHEIDSSLLHSIGIQLTAAQTTVGDLVLVVNDTSRNVQTLVDALSSTSDNVSSVYVKVAELSDRLTAMEDFLPQVLSLIKDNQAAILAAISACSSNAQGIFDVPNRRGRPFVGRQGVLNKLTEQLSKPSDVAKCAVIRGLGGQGKSRLAFEYCVKSRNSVYTTVFWVDATSQHTMRKAFELFYRKFRISSDEALEDMDAIVAFVRNSFECLKQPWLIVFDSYDNPADTDIRDYMPVSSLGSIIITSRRADAFDLASPDIKIELGSLDEKDACELLMGCASVPNSDTNEAAAKEIVNQLGRHALAIIQAGACMRRNRFAPLDFLGYYKDHKKQVLSRGISVTEYDRRSAEDPTSLHVFATWELSLRQLKIENGPKQFKEDLLTTFGFFEAQMISEEVFKTFCENIEPWDSEADMAKAPGAYLASMLRSWNAATFADVLAELFDLALIQSYERAEDGYYQITLHPLVREWVKLRMDDDRSVEYKILVAEVLIEFLNPSITKVSECKMAGASFDSLFNVRDDTLTGKSQNHLESIYVDVQQRLADALAASGNTKRALILTRHVVRAMERLYGTAHVKTISAKFNLSKLSFATGRCNTELVNWLRLIRDQTKRLFGVQHWTYRVAAAHLAHGLFSTDDVVEAVEIYKAQLTMEKSFPGADREICLDLSERLWMALTNLGRNDEAGIYDKILAAQMNKTNAPLRPWCIDYMTAKGYLARDSGLLEVSEERLNRAWQCARGVFGDKHLATFNSVIELANTKLKQGHFQDCEKLLVENTTDLLENFEFDHPVPVKKCVVLGTCYLQQGKLLDAKVEFCSLLNCREGMPPDTRASGSWAMWFLSEAHSISDGPNAADEMAEKVLVAYHSILGNDDWRSCVKKTCDIKLIHDFKEGSETDAR